MVVDAERRGQLGAASLFFGRFTDSLRLLPRERAISIDLEQSGTVRRANGQDKVSEKRSTTNTSNG